MAAVYNQTYLELSDAGDLISGLEFKQMLSQYISECLQAIATHCASKTLATYRAIKVGR